MRAAGRRHGGVRRNDIRRLPAQLERDLLGALAVAQQRVFADQLARMERRLAATDGFDRTALQWRIGHSRAAIDFCAAVAQGSVQ